jgi:hypothetical protein
MDDTKVPLGSYFIYLVHIVVVRGDAWILCKTDVSFFTDGSAFSSSI